MSRRKGQESGFALLFVLLAAAIIAIMLYAEMPRVAFEAQRLKEGDLITRGEEYKRAIRLYFRRFGRYPPSIDGLENTNNIRFLRKRFKDPMTGTDEWRLIHSGGGGFTDSLTMKPAKIAGTTDASEMASSSSGSASSDQPQVPQRWQLRRPGQTPALDASGNPVVQEGGDQTDYSQAIPGGPVAMPGQPVYMPGQQPPALQPGDPGYAPGTLQPGQPGYQPTQPGRRPYQPGGPGQPLYPPVPLPGMPSGLGDQFSNSSAPGDNQSSGSSSSSGATSPGGGVGMITGGAGIAGVASKYEAQGIKIYKDHAKYNEWEFIYDPRQEIVGLAGAQPQPSGDQTGLSGSPGFSTQGATPMGSQPGTPTGTPPGTSKP